jgi:dihydroxyacetone kinase-like protein
MTTSIAMDLTLEQGMDWMRGFADRLHERRDELTRLDAAIGDGDHGINMDRGFQAVVQKLDGPAPADLGSLFKAVGSTLISTVGGASGPLYGTAFLRMGGALAGKTSAGARELAAALGVAYDGVAMRGKSARGEKTMLDSFGPALDVFQAPENGDRDLTVVAEEAAVAAERGAAATIPLLATKGRASFLGENSIGHQDPGATSTALFFETLADALRGPGSPSWPS